jgi:tetratricopeptide (TPR) repeat protein
MTTIESTPTAIHSKQQQYDFLLDKSSEARGVRDYKLAHAHINHAIQILPHHFKAYYRRGLLCWRNGEVIDTYRAMKQALFYCTLQPNPHCEYWTYLFEACICELDKNLSKAEQLYDSAIKYCEMLHQQTLSQNQQQESTMERNNTTKKKRLSLRFNNLLRYRSSGETDDDLSVDVSGEELIEQQQQQSQQITLPNNSDEIGFEAYLNLGIVKMEQACYDEAISLFYSSLKHTTKLNLTALCYNNIACCFVRQLNDTTALKFFTKAIETYPYDVLFCVNRMRTFRRLERYYEGLSDCHSVIKLTNHPKTLAEAYADKADIIRKMKKSGAQKNLSIESTLSPLEEKMLREKNHDLVCKYYEKAIECDPEYEYAYLIMTAVCADHNQMDRALDCCKRGMKNAKHDDWQGLKELHRIRSAVYRLCLAKKAVQQTASSTSPDMDEHDNDDNKLSELTMTSCYSNNILNASVGQLTALEKKDREMYDRLSTELCNRIC